jgi:GNAT superfamily N-acetyltransferase
MLVIRTPASTEKQDWLPLWHGYLHFYQCTIPDDITDLTWQRFHDPAEPIHLLCGHDGETMAGFVTYVFHRSTWAKVNYCYLEDLFVSDSARGKGVGRALIQAVQERALAAGSSRLYWNTRDSNTQARLLYDKVAKVTDFVQYRLALGDSRLA